MSEERAKLEQWQAAGCFLDFGKPYGSVASWKILDLREWCGHLQMLCQFDRIGGNGKRWMYLSQVKRAWFFEMA